MQNDADDFENRDSTPDVALFILNALEKEGIKHVFLVPGYLIDPFLLSFPKSKITPIVAAHEGGAAYMADGYGRASQNFGVCMGIGGPGVTNMTTAVSAAYGDRSPVLIIAGRIPSSWEGKGAFQDSSSSIGIDDIAIMRPMTEFSAAVSDVEGVNIFLRKALRVIRDVESLPVFLSVPENVQRERCIASYESPPRGPWRVLDREAVLKVPELLTENPLIAILAGNGSVKSQASQEIREFAEEYTIPVVTSMRAKGAIPEDHRMSFGVFGLGGTLQANQLIMGSQRKSIPKAGVLLVLGTTLNENNTYLGNPEFAPTKNLVLVDINPNSNRDIEYKHSFVMGDVKAFFEWMKEHEATYRQKLKETEPMRLEWTKAILDNVPRYDQERERTAKLRPIHPARAIADLRKVANNFDDREKGLNSVLVVDSGAHTFFAGHHWDSWGPNEFLFLSTTGPMGYGIAMAIGAKLARPARPCICVVGDGSMLMHGLELRTAVKNSIALVVVVINNGALGNVYLRFVEQNQSAAAELTKIDPPQDWAYFAKSLGADGIVIEDPEQLIKAYEKAFEYTTRERKPFVVDVRCNREFKPPNQNLGEQERRGLRGARREYYVPHW